LAADEGLRHAVYVALLTRLELCVPHFDALRGRGLSADEIALRMYRTADTAKLRTAVDALLGVYSRETLLTVPGFVERSERVVFQAAHGFLIPARDILGRVVGLKVRHDAGHNGPKYTWASTREASCGNLVHVPLGV